MNRAALLALLRQHLPEVRQRFGVAHLALFGSQARAQARDDSDVDVLVAFDGRADARRYFGLQFYLEDVLDRPVDLVTESALRPELRQQVLGEAIHVG